MKTDLKSLKKELKRLSDLDTLKKEVARIAKDIRKFDVHINLTPQAKKKLSMLEKRFHALMKVLSDLQKEIDARVGNLLKYIRASGRVTTTVAKSAAKSAARPQKAPAKKKTSKKARRPARKASK